MMRKMKYSIVLCMAGVLLALLAGCDREMDGADRAGSTSEILFSGVDEFFVQTRAIIGADGTGPKFGDIHIRQTKFKQEEGEGNFLKWGHYEVEGGVSGSLKDLNQDEEKLFWEDNSTEYIFRGISVPPARDAQDGEIEGEFNVTITEENGNITGGTVTFGGYETGLEYFIGMTAGPKSKSNNSNSNIVSLTFYRQVCKVVFLSFTHKTADGTQQGEIEKCKIIFPNLPKTATFNMDEFYPKDLAVGPPENDDYAMLTYGVPISGEECATMEWRRNPKNEDAKPDLSLTEKDYYYAFYLPPFKFWGGVDSKPENQPGFFIVQTEEKAYTGNIYGFNGDVDNEVNPKVVQLHAADFCRLKVTLQDGKPSGGGSGSAIAQWEVAPETTIPHHRVPGIYSQEDAQKLLEALQSDNPSANIPAIFFKEEEIEGMGGTVKVIRLFKNIDWSEVTDTELTIPDGFVLMGQGYNVTLVAGASIVGKQAGKLYINGVLYEDGERVTEDEEATRPTK